MSSISPDEVKPLMNKLTEWKYSLWVQGFILFLVSIIISGYQVYSANQELQIPLVLSIQNPSLFPNDPFVSTLTHYAAPIWWVIAYISNYLPLEDTLMILFVLTRVLLFVAAARLAFSITPGSKLAAIGAMAFLALGPSTMVGHGTIVANYFEQTSLSIAFLMLATADLLSMRPLQWAIWLGLGFNLNSMYGVYACTYFAAVFLFDKDYRTNWKDWILPGFLFFLLASPSIIMTLDAYRSGFVESELWLRASEVRLSHHLFPLTWKSFPFNLLLAFLSSFAIATYLARNDLRRLYQQARIWLLVGLFWLFYAFIAAYLARSPAMLVMQPARGLDLLFIFASISMICLFSHLIKTKPFNVKLWVILFFFSILWFWFFEFTFFLEWIFLVLAIALIWEPMWRTVMKEGRPLRLANIVVLIVAFLGIITFATMFYSSRVISIVRYPGSQIVQISNWAKAETSPQDTFLVDPNWGEFRALSERPVFGTWKDGAAMLWERNYVTEWTRRMESFGFDFENTTELGTPDGFKPLSGMYAAMNDEIVADLSKIYPIRYWVVSSDHPSSFPVVYKTNSYKVLDLQP